MFRTQARVVRVLCVLILCLGIRVERDFRESPASLGGPGFEHRMTSWLTNLQFGSLPVHTMHTMH